MTHDEVLFERRGQLGVVILNRPQAVNAINTAMAAAMLAQLGQWAHDDSVQTVLVYGNGDRGLCAGGDVTGIFHDIPSGGAATAEFWRIEYALNALISHYPKPYVPFMDGLVLGGGVGISAHGNIRVVTERTRCGMPETTIGFVPDVGGTFLLSRAPGEAGTHAGLTGAQLSGADTIFLGLADYFVPSENLPALAAALEHEPAATAVERFAKTAPASDVAAKQDWIDSAYASDDAEQIVRNLRAIGSEYAAVIESKSPTAVKVTLASLRRAARLATLEEVLAQEYRVGLRFVAGAEMREGIRAQVVDKDRKPQWNPATLAEVSVADVESYFAPLGAADISGELDLAASDAS